MKTITINLFQKYEKINKVNNKLSQFSKFLLLISEKKIKNKINNDDIVTQLKTEIKSVNFFLYCTMIVYNFIRIF